MTSKSVFAITNVDSLLGYAQAYRFLEGFQAEARKPDTEIRLLCRQRQGLKELEEMGGKIVEINYLDEGAVCRALNDVQYLLFFPENSHNRHQEGLNVLAAARKLKVDYVSMLSFVGVDQAQEHKQWSNLREYYALEKLLEESFDKEKYCVFRIPIVSQVFYYLTPMIEDQNKVRMPVGKQHKFNIVDLSDVIDAVYNLSTEEPKSALSSVFARVVRGEGDRKNQNLFQFTPDHLCLTGADMAHKMTEGLDKENDLGYDRVDVDAMKQYLRGIRDDDRFKERPRTSGKGDKAHVFPLGCYLNDNVIDTLLEWWDLADKDLANTVTRDLERALQHSPEDLREFFKNNRDQFRRLR